MTAKKDDLYSNKAKGLSSPILNEGGGVHFEDRISVSFVLEMLINEYALVFPTFQLTKYNYKVNRLTLR